MPRQINSQRLLTLRHLTMHNKCGMSKKKKNEKIDPATERALLCMVHWVKEVQYWTLNIQRRTKNDRIGLICGIPCSTYQVLVIVCIFALLSKFQCSQNCSSLIYVSILSIHSLDELVSNLKFTNSVLCQHDERWKKKEKFPFCFVRFISEKIKVDAWMRKKFWAFHVNKGAHFQKFWLQIERIALKL